MGLAATTFWLALHSVTVAPAPTLALDNLRGDWIVPLLVAALAAHAGGRLESKACDSCRGKRTACAHAVVSRLAALALLGAGMSGPWADRLEGERALRRALTIRAA
jgi:hypothetical protein